MKNYLPISLWAFLCLFSSLSAQDFKGFTTINSTGSGVSFLYKDKTDKLWVGMGAHTNTGKRYSLGLFSIENKIQKTYSSNGVFTDVLETENGIYFTALDGFYRFKNDTLKKLHNLTGLTSICIYNKEILVGSEGLGLYTINDSNYYPFKINSDSTTYDSIYSLCVYNSTLWVAANRKVLKYGNGGLKMYNPPYKNSVYSDVVLRQQHIISMQVDGYGNLWILNGNLVDTMHCLYVLENEKFVNAEDKYKNQCLGWNLIPPAAQKLGRSEWGHILLPTFYGYLELSDRLDYHILISPGEVNHISQMNTGTNNRTVIYEASDKKKYYAGTDIFEIDPSEFDYEEFKKAGIGKNFSVEELNLNDIHSSLSNDGLFFNGNIFQEMERKALFQLPSLSCSNILESSGLWMGAYDDQNQIRAAAASYRSAYYKDFTAGPIDTITSSYDTILQLQFNRIWKISRKTIDEFLLHRNEPNYPIPGEILEWPGNAPSNCHYRMAPYVDMDNNGKYEPVKGDYPKMKGDQMLWWVFNDAKKHRNSLGNSMLFQVNASAYEYHHVEITPDMDDHIINRSVYIDMDIINLSPSAYTNVLAGMYIDPDIGNYTDDRFGFNLAGEYAYAYNSDSMDELGFGANPPLLYIKQLKPSLHNLRTYSPFSFGFPNSDNAYYRALRSGEYSKDSQITLFDTNFYKKPCEFKGGSQGTDVRLVLSGKKNQLAKGEHFNLVYAFTLLQKPGVNFLRSDCDLLNNTNQKQMQWWNSGTYPSKPYWNSSISELNQNNLNIYPNPGSGKYTVHIDSELIEGDLVVRDISGKVVYNSEIPLLSEFELDLSNLSNGIYIVFIRTDSFTEEIKLILNR